jgi:hypothetical protein
MFLEKFNGVSYILEVEWMSNVEFELIQIVPGVLVKGVLLSTGKIGLS